MDQSWLMLASRDQRQHYSKRGGDFDWKLPGIGDTKLTPLILP